MVIWKYQCVQPHSLRAPVLWGRLVRVDAYQTARQAHREHVYSMRRTLLQAIPREEILSKDERECRRMRDGCVPYIAHAPGHPLASRQMCWTPP